jgi:hypothetical protein
MTSIKKEKVVFLFRVTIVKMIHNSLRRRGKQKLPPFFSLSTNREDMKGKIFKSCDPEGGKLLHMPLKSSF